MAYESLQPRNYDPAFSNIPVVNTTWGTNSNAVTVTDASCHPTSCVVVTATSLPVGNWKVVVSQGSFVVTSTDPELAATGFNYRII